MFETTRVADGELCSVTVFIDAFVRLMLTTHIGSQPDLSKLSSCTANVTVAFVLDLSFQDLFAMSFNCKAIPRMKFYNAYDVHTLIGAALQY
jgi:hypothetical protein